MASSDPHDPLDQLLALEAFGIKVGLDNIRALTSALDLPQTAFPSIVVAGTNGKGSVSAIVETSLRASGLRTGLYTSPHLLHVSERFVLNGRPANVDTLREVVRNVLAVSAELARTSGGSTSATFFEVATAAAFELFRRAAVDVAVLEVGLGGRFDATNIVTPLAAAIVSIAHDHEQYLGQTLASIAFEKAGVIKSGRPVVVGDLPAEAMAVVRQVATAQGASLTEALRDVKLDVVLEGGKTLVRLATPTRDYGQVTLALRGRHQAVNAVVATRLLEVVDAEGLAVSAEAIRAGLSQALWPGRLEQRTWPDGRSLWLDAAHNPAGAEVLAAFLRESRLVPLPIVFGAMKDKDSLGMLVPLLPCASVVICTRAGTPRAQDPQILATQAATLAPSAPVEIAETVTDALALAWQHAPCICLAGSIFLVGDALAAIELEAPWA